MEEKTDSPYTGFSALEQIRMIAAFAKLHEYIEQTHFIRFTGAIYDIDVLH